MSALDFYERLRELGVTHHRPRVIQRYLEDVLFPDVNFAGRKVLDVGGGTGLCSYFAVFRGAASSNNVEPLLAGSEDASLVAFSRAQEKLGTQGAQLVNESIQDHVEHCGTYDVIILHDAINHLDEGSYTKLHEDPAAFAEYVGLFRKIAARHSTGGDLVIADCARRNFFGDLGMRAPFAPSINWKLHQDPRLVAKVLEAAGYSDVRWKWTPLKRAGLLGRIAARLGRVPSYFLQSHFVLFARRSA